MNSFTGSEKRKLRFELLTSAATTGVATTGPKIIFIINIAYPKISRLRRIPGLKRVDVSSVFDQIYLKK